MPVVTDSSRRVFNQVTYDLESKLEADVVALADRIFGCSTIYVDVKKKMKGGDIITIPDGYLIDMTDVAHPQLFVIENEIVKHDAFKHIGIQMLKFVVAFDDAQPQLRKHLMERIQGSEDHLARLKAHCAQAPHPNIDNYLDHAVYGDFRGLVIIDEARPELHRVLKKIRADISVLELKAYASADGSVLHLHDTLYDVEDEPIVGGASVDIETEKDRRMAIRANSDTIIVPAHEDGFQRVAIGEEQWHAIRIGAAMKGKLKYIAFYRNKPESAVTHYAEIESIEPYEDSTKYRVRFKGGLKEMPRVATEDPRNSPQGPIYVRFDALARAGSLEQARALTLPGS